MSTIRGRGEAAREPQSGGWETYLDKGERILWEGAPATGIRIRGSDIAMSVFGVFFLSFAIFWVYMASSMARGTPDEAGLDIFALVFPMFGLPFVAAGAYMLFGQYFWKAYVRSRTRYALTNKRGIIAKSAWGRKLKSYPINADTTLEFLPGPEATIWFAEEVKRGQKGRTYTQKKGFEYVANGDALYRLMREVQQGDVA